MTDQIVTTEEPSGRVVGHLLMLMERKMARQLGVGAIQISVLYRMPGTDYYHGRLGSGATFVWPASGELTVRFDHGGAL